jgi:amino acid adenylation domain-containing protein
MMIALLGVLKSGAAYVPMDPTYPLDRITHVLEETQTALLLTDSQLTQNLPLTGARIVRLDEDWSAIAATANGKSRMVKFSATDLAYVIYTSGSTGKPKGVEISHRAIVNLLSAMGKRPGLTARDTLLAVTTLSFDIAGLELFLPLCTGAKVEIASRVTATDGGLLLKRLVSSGATVIQATPVTFRLLIEAGWEPMPSLKVLCGGEALPRELADAILTRARSLWNMYGPTETTIWSSTLQLEPSDGPVVIGPPIANTRFHVVDAHDELVPMGRTGELLIGGDGLARGYYRRSELSGERFIRDPFSIDPSARLYRTGDLVRRLPDGTFEFLGRLDNQVKLRGFRIELGEIEEALLRYPGVREAVVALREDAPGDRRLVAYICTDHQALSLTPIREFLTGKLPNYMLPSAVVQMESMPLTPNGKVDRKALPRPEVGAERTAEFVAPRTTQEQTLATIWAEVLRLEQVGVRDNLFELGADSLHIFQIASRANRAGIRVTPAQFLKYRTIASLLEQLAKGADDNPAPVLPGIVKVSREKYRVDRSSL